MIRIAAIADVHCHAGLRGVLKPLFEGINNTADVLVIGGDLTVSGTLAETRVLLRELEDVRVPVVAVLGNHDFDQHAEREVMDLLRQHGIFVLDGEHITFEIRGETVGIAGAKGFGGGFDKYLLAPFGEGAIKDFVHAGLTEVQKIDRALNQLRADYRVVLLHYAPIRQTLVGESLELYPFLGSSSLARPIDAVGADVVFHGHAHYGAPRGQTKTGIPVLNVAKPIVGKPVVWTLESRVLIGARKMEAETPHDS